jgi:hypothetical protein
MILRVPVAAAGAIYATARNADGTAAGEVGCSMSMLRPPPGIVVGSLHNPKTYTHDDGSRLFIQSPLPLGGTYVAVCKRGCSFSTSEPMELTENAPDRRVNLKFDRGVAIEGRVLPPAGRLLDSVTVTLDWSWEGGAWTFPAMARTAADENGRFRFPDASPSRGAFSATASGPGLQSATVPVDFDKLPLAIQMKEGLKLAGRVLEATSGLPVISALVTARSRDGKNWRTESAQTDAAGNFMFDTLGDGDYLLDVGGAEHPGGVVKFYKAGQSEPVVLRITPARNSGLRLAESPHSP